MENQNLDFLVIAPTPFYANRGCHMRIRGEAEALQKKGKSLVIITYNEGENVNGLETIRAPFGFGFGSGLATSWKNLPAGFFLFWTVLYETIYRRPKVIYGHLFEGAAIGIVVKYLAILISLFSYRPLLVMDTQGDLVEEMRSYGMYKRGSWLEAIFRFWDKFILFFPNHIFASSILCVESLKRVRSKSHPVNLPDGISIFQKDFSLEVVNRFRGAKGKEKALAKLNLPPVEADLIKKWLADQNQILVYTGSYADAKGFPDFVKKCMPYLLKNYNLRFLFGGGRSRDIIHLENLITANPSSIISHSDLNLDNLLYFNVLGDITIDCKPPSTSESSGKMLNYMAVGLPVVCFNQKNNRFALKDGGLFARDYAEFTQNILKLANDPDQADKMGEKNLERAWSEFTWDKAAQKIIDTLA